ncbi:TraA [Enterobacter sp. KINAN-G]|nr:TraA [Enterobacter sp. KINAN-G]
MTDVSVINAVPATPEKKKFSKVALLKALKFALPVAALAAFFPDTVLASTAGKDLMSSGDATVKGTFGKDSSVVKWVTRMDGGQASRLGIRYFPALMLADPKSGTVKPVSYGFISQDDLAKQFLNVSTDFAPNF